MQSTGTLMFAVRYKELQWIDCIKLISAINVLEVKYSQSWDYLLLPVHSCFHYQYHSWCIRYEQNVYRTSLESGWLGSEVVRMVTTGIKTLRKENPQMIAILDEFGGKIIDYFRKSDIDEDKLQSISDDELSKALATHCNDDKVVQIVTSLRTKLHKTFSSTDVFLSRDIYQGIQYALC